MILLKSIVESIDGNVTKSTFEMYHGGKRWSMLPTDLQSSAKGRYEAGVGIYFTNSYETARSYAKGSRVVHRVEIDRNYVDIKNVRVPVRELVDVVKSFHGLKKKREIIEDLLRNSQRTGKPDVSLDTLNNLIVNHNAGSGNAGLEVSRYFVSKGADASLENKGSGEVWLVVFNPKILKKVDIIDPSKVKSDFKFMLPRLDESHDRDYDVAEDFYERRDRELDKLAISLKQSGGKGRLHWTTVSASLLKRVWLQFGKYNKINENDLDKISDQILTNIARLDASTIMMGHTEKDGRELCKDAGHEFTDEEWDVWMTDYFTDLDGAWLLSDYGLPKVKNLYSAVFNADSAEQKLYAIDKVLNVIHQRSDLAAMFVEGGKSTLNIIANQGGYTSDI